MLGRFVSLHAFVSLTNAELWSEVEREVIFPTFSPSQQLIITLDVPQDAVCVYKILSCPPPQFETISSLNIAKWTQPVFLALPVLEEKKELWGPNIINTSSISIAGLALPVPRHWCLEAISIQCIYCAPITLTLAFQCCLLPVVLQLALFNYISILLDLI